ncbi:thioredoxin [Candidatus Endoriftia persephone str. Guaymas]|jgi:hypothetical protein|uniref:BZIP domain-containing protein n=3 Tax=Gammaproteobacteria TaxID=1236 RepID=G2FG31_9GAMM|nr:hypothetical protein [Candidatus Endoriftia persephone]EGV52720.1 hypothetical protein Rifp1Sym_ac00070 [endosymbiont of Riftia pachyptila (vent Ph05)]EGW54264.1 hypothetical protein TevJSym_ao00500 [endosymbiont of Tevnia jerichonana (vent Tica)]MBA1332772.1 thioredoxin [Candidatus Endoriftia persephone str. Guaymas]USF87437.1 sensor domain-containing protein [Candidatus Endoriftia persephone]
MRQGCFAGLVLGVGLCVGWIGVPVTAAADESIYRCTMADGAVEFRQRPCQQGVQSETRVVEQTRGFEAPAQRPAAAKKRKLRRKKSNAGAAERARKRQQERCFRTEQKLQRVENRLRAGYKASHSARLHQRQDEYEDYLSRFCH